MIRQDLLDYVIDVLTDLTSRVPSSPEAPRDVPATRATELTMAAASQAAATAGALALPAGPVGMLTVVPDLVAVWRIQRQLVADIAACYGRSADLRREAMMYCLFRHAAAQVVRDLAVRIGQRLLLRRSSMAVIERSLERLGVAVSQRVVGRAVSRWIPVAGAVGVGVYAFYDTLQVGRTAQELFASDLMSDSDGPEPPTHAVSDDRHADHR
jgi:hypothetical protein